MANIKFSPTPITIEIEIPMSTLDHAYWDSVEQDHAFKKWSGLKQEIYDKTYKGGTNFGSPLYTHIQDLEQQVKNLEIEFPFLNRRP